MLKAPPIVLAATLAAVLIMEFLLLPQTENAGLTVGARWREENKKLFQMNCLRNFASGENAIWQSALHFPQKQAGHPRILVVGDSFVWGDGYANANDLWWRLLERQLHRMGYKQAEVCAVGLCGLTMRNAIPAAEKAIDELKPDIIVWSYIPNNANEQLSERPQANRLEQVTRHFRFFIPQICSFIISKITGPAEELLSLYSEAPKNSIEWEKRLLTGANFDRLKKTMCKLADLFTAYDKPSVVVLLPTIPINGYNEECFEPIKTFLSLMNVDCLDLSGGYLAWVQKEMSSFTDIKRGLTGRRFLWINPANTHPSTALGQYYSVLVAERLTQAYPQFFVASVSRRTARTYAETGKSYPPRNGPVVINDCMPPCLITKLKKTKLGYQLNIPKNEHQLFMPLGKPFVQLNLKEPLRISEIELRGKYLSSAHLFCTMAKTKFERDTGQPVDLGFQKQDPSPPKFGILKWKLDSKEPVNTIRIARAQFSSASDSEYDASQIEIRFPKND